MELAPSVQRKIMWLTPMPFLEFLSRAYPKFVIGLLCHWLNEKNAIIEERFLAPIQIAPVPVAKKLGQLSVLSILNLLKQDERLWQFYAPTVNEGVVINLTALPYILLELMFDLGGKDGREKVRDILVKCRTTIGSGKQLDLLRAFKTDVVIDLFEMMPEAEVGMILKNFQCDPAMVAFWLNHWDLRMERTDQPPKSAYWLGKIPGRRGFDIEAAMRALEFRRKFESVGDLYKYQKDWKDFIESPAP